VYMLLYISSDEVAHSLARMLRHLQGRIPGESRDSPASPGTL